MKHSFIYFLFASNSLVGQSIVTSDWGGFSQNFDVSAYRGGEFRLTGYVRAMCEDENASAHLFARVDKKKGASFLDNMKDRPITKAEWELYTIEGLISNRAEKLFIGGMYIGVGRFSFDSFSLNVRSKNGDWEMIEIVEPGFEADNTESGWQSFFNRYELTLTTVNVQEGNKSLLIDTSYKLSKAEGDFVKANGIDIHYREYGQGDAVLLLHGNSESGQSFSRQIPDLSQEYYVLAMDSRGQGYSTNDGTKVSYELMAEDVIAFLNALNIEKVNVIGWSDGGIIGLLLAMKYPDRINSLATMGANLFNDHTSLESEVNEELKKELQQLTDLNKEEHAFRIEMIKLMLTEPNIDPKDLSRITCATLIMAGSKDAVKRNHTKLIASKIPNAELVIFKDGTHDEPVENPDRFNKTVMKFLEANTK